MQNFLIFNVVHHIAEGEVLIEQGSAGVNARALNNASEF